MELFGFTHLSDDTAVAKMGHPVLWFGCRGLQVGEANGLGGFRLGRVLGWRIP